MNQSTLEKMHLMNLSGMAAAYKEFFTIDNHYEWSHEQLLAFLLDNEYDERKTSTIQRRIKQANFVDNQACIEGIKYLTDRELNVNLISLLSSNDYIQNGQNVLIIGATGAGKSYVACALGHQACLQNYKTLYIRLPDLIVEIKMARAEGKLPSLLKKYAKLDLLIIDEWLLTPLDTIEVSDILEVIERRTNKHSTIICSQIQISGWYERLGESAITEALLDRILSKAHRIEIKGKESMRSRTDY
ncbi:IS21-like element helper ATPase IstB [Tuanshanicoccus lijuaniae]|uniref:IS21-like element helper ATPase IstB n=1 Tax=Aerococcaceae bacterium zg-1292 TaxID=2774330 RepID=UPI001935A642|nr:ATP-binding protein [Aerococcaceae bacterium zg-1292]MBF6625453.1 ATP-binding protein [Aerococcaceae bacterium zg-BR9]QQA36622.1 IS21-like element helper ATPase IstB [Aerococcaceae bacterium zg-1292]